MSAKNEESPRDRLLGPLHMNFLAAEQAYSDYMANGKSFLFACSLRRINAGIRELLIERGHLLPPDRQGHALALIRHYDVWLTLWDDLARTEPATEEPFVFENPVRFPKAAQEEIERLYRQSVEAAERN